jgi:hypothetical protein
LEPTTDERWGELIDRGEAVLIYKVCPAYNVSGTTGLPERFQDKPMLVVNHGRRNRLPECLSTISELVNTRMAEFKKFGPSGYQMPPPTPSPDALPDEEEERKKK